MKKGIFVAFIYSNFHKNIGIINKFDSFIHYFNKNGTDIILKPVILVPENFEAGQLFPELKFIPINFMAPANGFLDYIQGKIASVKKFIIEVKRHKPDFIYLRYPVADPILFLTLKYLKKIYPDMKLITEHQTKELFEVKLLKKPLHFFLEYIFGKYIRNMLDGIVSMSKSISVYQKSQISSKIKNTRFLVLGNSVDLKKNRIRRIVPGYDSEELKLGFVGNLSSWHGIDRLIHGLSDYIGTRKIKLYLVGKGSEFDKLKSELNLIPSKERVVFLGSLTGKDLADFYCSINIAVSSLALHRLEMTDGGPLKTPEYMAKGIPFIIGYNDLEIPPHFPFVFRVSSDDKPIDINKLFCFYDTLIGKKQTDMMRKFAKKNMCFSVKTAKLYNFFKNLV